jgi:hypothetical protein
MVAKNPDVAKPRRRRKRRRRHVEFGAASIIAVPQKHHVDLGHFEAGHGEILAQHRQFLELEAQGLDVPGAGLGDTVEREAQAPQLVGVEVVDDDAGDLRDSQPLGGFPDPMAFDDRAIAGNQDRATNAEFAEAGVNPALLTASRRRGRREAGFRLSVGSVSNSRRGAKSLRRLADG